MRMQACLCYQGHLHGYHQTTAFFDPLILLPFLLYPICFRFATHTVHLYKATWPILIALEVMLAAAILRI